MTKNTDSPAHDDAGFSLIEVLVVVAIILILAAIAIPNLLKSKIVANEASAVSSIRQIMTAQATYQSTYPTVGFADNLTKLSNQAGGPPDPNNAGILDWVLGCTSQPCPKSGYNFSIASTAGTPANSYYVFGVPIDRGKTGIRGFCGEERGAIRADPAGGTTCTAALQ